MLSILVARDVKFKWDYEERRVRLDKYGNRQKIKQFKQVRCFIWEFGDMYPNPVILGACFPG